MKREPECTAHTNTSEKQPEGCLCWEFHAAYLRGREDAARAVYRMRADNYDMVWKHAAMNACENGDAS